MIKQTFTVATMLFAGILQRPLSALVTIIGVAAVVAVMTALLALGSGLATSRTKNVGFDMAVVLAEGTASDYLGSIPREVANIVSEAPGVKLDQQGRALVIPKTSLVVTVTRKKGRVPANINLIGLPLKGFGHTDGARLTKGRLFRPGLRELVVGRVANQEFEGLSIGNQINLRGSPWTVVGEYESRGSTVESALIGDADTILPAFDRNGYQNIVVQLRSPSDFDGFRAALMGDPRLSVDVKVYRKYLDDQLRQVTAVLNFFGYFVGTIMGFGAFFGILNTIYTIVDSRRRELSTLRAIGFRNHVIVFAVMLEALALTLPGAAIGVMAAWILFNGKIGQVSDLAFPISVTPTIAISSILWVLVIGLIGGIIPSIINMRSSIAESLRCT